MLRSRLKSEAKLCGSSWRRVGPKMAPSSPQEAFALIQDGSKMAFRRFRSAPKVVRMIQRGVCRTHMPWVQQNFPMFRIRRIMHSPLYNHGISGYAFRGSTRSLFTWTSGLVMMTCSADTKMYFRCGRTCACNGSNHVPSFWFAGAPVLDHDFTEPISKHVRPSMS